VRKRSSKVRKCARQQKQTRSQLDWVRQLTSKVSSANAVVHAVRRLSVTRVSLVVLLLHIRCNLANHSLVLDRGDANLVSRERKRDVSCEFECKSEKLSTRENAEAQESSWNARVSNSTVSLWLPAFLAAFVVLTSTALACLSAGIWLSIILTTWAGFSPGCALILDSSRGLPLSASSAPRRVGEFVVPHSILLRTHIISINK